jgi:hypothetical protein
MSISPLAKKLRIADNQLVLIINPPSEYISKLGELPEGTTIVHEPQGKYPHVQLFVNNRRAFDHLGHTALSAVEYDGVFWVCYPKRSSKTATDLSRDALWDLYAGSGLHPVSQVSINEIWSAVRFRPNERVGK